MPLYKDIVSRATRVLVWSIDETELELCDFLGRSDFNLPQNGRRRLERLSVYCLFKYVGLDFPYSYDSVGRPITNNGVFISVSHSYGYATLAISTERHVGVDVERIDRNFDKVTSRYLTEAERALEPSQTQLAIIWCAKEAIYKLPWSKPLELQSMQVEFRSPDLLCAEVSDGNSKTSLLLNVKIFDGYALVWNVI